MKRLTYRILFAAFVAFAGSAFFAGAANPMATDYTFAQCEGSLTPYPDSELNPAVYPDSLVPVFINHVGRHGARYPASAANTLALKRALLRADSLRTITPLGRRLLALTEMVQTLAENRWGALDSLGEDEQRAIASRLFYNFGDIFAGENARVKAYATYSPRAMMSMFSFIHQLDRMDNRIEFDTRSGRSQSILLRPFDEDKDYIEFRKDGAWKPVYDEYFAATCPVGAVRRVLGAGYPFGSDDEARNLALVEYYVVAGLRAMQLPSEMATYFTRDEANALWSCFNLRQYLCRTASTVSTVPEEIASPLVLDLISTTDAFVTGQDTDTRAIFRFAHAETLMPLLSLLKIPGCRYLSNYFDTVGKSWRDFDVVPMAANLQIIVFQAKASGQYYVRFDLNERPVRLRPGEDASTIYPWGEARRFMINCVPIYRNI